MAESCGSTKLWAGEETEVRSERGRKTNDQEQNVKERRESDFIL